MPNSLVTSMKKGLMLMLKQVLLISNRIKKKEHELIPKNIFGKL